MIRKAFAAARTLTVVIFFIATFTLLATLAALAQQADTGQSLAGPSPSFSPAVAYSTGEPGAVLNGENNTVAIADVNGDGKPDLVVADYCGSVKSQACPLGEATGMVSVLLANGDGTFQPPLTYSSGGFYAIAVLVADLNADGKSDLIVANGCTEEPDVCPTEGSVGVLLGNGDGTFQPVQTVAAGGVPFAMTVADVNKDGKPDVIIANQGGGNGGDGSVGVLLGTGTGSFQPLQTYDSGGTQADFVVVTDVNNDGKPDVLVTNFSVFCQSCPGNLGVLLGNGDGTFEQVVTYRANGFASGFVVADMNADGIPDVIVNEGGIFNGGMFSVLFGNGNGSFRSAVAYSTGGDYNYLPSVADINGDQRLDVIVPNGQLCSGFKNSAGCVAVLLGNGDGTLQPPVLYAASGGAGWLAVADLNGDGIPDVTFVGQGGGKGGYVGVLEGNGDGTFQPATVYGTGGYSSTWVSITDLNGDGKPDLLVVNPGQTPSTNGSMGVLLNNTSLSRASTTTSLTSSLNPSLAGQAVTFTAAVSSAAGAPPNGESVTFHNGSGVLGTASLSGGIASLNASSLPVGIFTITATYAGDAKFAASTSPGLRQVVNSTTKSATSTALVSSLNPSIYGQKISWTATVKTSGSVEPTGKVNFTWNGHSIGTATLNASGVATLSKSNLNVYTYPLSAVYAGDADNVGSASTVLNQVVKQTTSTAKLISSANPSTLGQVVTFTASISSPTVTATGPVTFTSGTTVLGTSQLSGGKATLTTSTLAVGATTVKATYYGDSNIAGSSASVTETVQQ